MGTCLRFTFHDSTSSLLTKCLRMYLYLFLEVRAGLLLESLIHRQPFHDAQIHLFAGVVDVVAWTVRCEGLFSEGQLVGNLMTT